MTQMDLLISGVLVFVTALIGMIFTIVEFYRTKRTVVKLDSQDPARRVTPAYPNSAASK